MPNKYQISRLNYGTAVQNNSGSWEPREPTTTWTRVCASVCVCVRACHSMKQSLSSEVRNPSATQEPVIYPYSERWQSLQSSPSPLIFLTSTLILSSYLRLFPSGLYPPNSCMHLPPTIRSSCPAHLKPFDLITNIVYGEEFLII